MKKGQQYIGIIEELEFPNKGILFYSEENEQKETVITKVQIKGTLPGQKVSFVVSKKQSGRCEGRLLEVLEKSKLEDTEAICPHFGLCGGCSYQNISYEKQLVLKENQVKQILDQAIQEPYLFEGILPSPLPFSYRNKMEFSFGDEYKGGPLALGLHRKGSFYDILSISDCKIVNSDYNLILNETLSYFKEKKVDFYHKMLHHGNLRHLLIRRAVKTGEMTVNLVTTSEMKEKKNLVQEWAKRILALPVEGKIVGITHIVNDSLADVVKSDETYVLAGQDYFYEELLGLKFKISTFSFFQTNSLGAEVLYEKAREYICGNLELTKDKTVFDLYSGTGTIAQILAPVSKKVIGVEIVGEAVEAAKENAALNGLTNCEFIAGDVLKVIEDIPDKPDLIVLDPPRDGIHPKALSKILDYNVEHLIYISCKPTSLARDLEMIQERGYRVEKACAVDEFPQSVHVESVVLLTKEHR